MNVKDLENQCDRLNQEVQNLSNMNNKEQRERMDCERNIQQLDAILKERLNDLHRLKFDLDNSSVKNDKLLEDNNKLFNEIERLKTHIMVITEQNQSVNLFINIFRLLMN